MSQDAKLVSRVAECLPEMSSQQKQGWIENPRRLKQVLRVLSEVPSDPRVWKRVKLGTGINDADGFRKAIKDAGMKTGDWASDILDKQEFTVAKKPTKVDLVVPSVKELGFVKGAALRDIYEVARKRDLELCPAEVGPQLRLQYADQPPGECVVVGMEPITDSDGFLRLFYVEHDGNGRWLISCYDDPDGVWSPSYRFAFVLPSK